MADQDPRAKEQSGDELLATMNEHLARFFQHADTLLGEWKAYGESLRATLNSQVEELDTMVARAVRESGRSAAAEIATHMDAHIEQAVRASIDSLRRELDDLARETRQSGAGGSARRLRADSEESSRAVAVHDDKPKAAGPWHSGIVLLALTAANVILAVLLVSGIRSCRGDIYEHRAPAKLDAPVDASSRADAPASPQPDSAGIGDGDSDPEAAAERAAMCATLAQGYEPEAARSFAGAAATSLCADEQTALSVTQNLMANLPAEGQPKKQPDKKPDSKKPDSKKPDSKKSSKKTSSKKTSDKKTSDKKKSDQKAPKKADG